MGSRFKKTLVPESIRESLHSWCKRVKERSKRDSLRSHTMTSVSSLESTTDERDEITIASGTLSRSSSLESQNQLTVTSSILPQEAARENSGVPHASRMDEFLAESVNFSSQPPAKGGEECSLSDGEKREVKTLFELLRST